MLRLCITKRKYSHPHLGLYPECRGEARNLCSFIHDVETTCWSLHDQLVRAPDRQFRSHQTCPVVARQTSNALGNISSYCKYGHDLEGARVEAWWSYWEHTARAMRYGARGVIIEDRYGQLVRRPLRPKRQTLSNTSYARSLDGSLSGRTWHGHEVTMTCMVSSDRPLVDRVSKDMAVDWERGELRPAEEMVSGTWDRSIIARNGSDGLRTESEEITQSAIGIHDEFNLSRINPEGQEYPPARSIDLDNDHLNDGGAKADSDLELRRCKTI